MHSTQTLAPSITPDVLAQIESLRQLERPEFIRLPKGGPEHFSGLTRSKLNALVLPCPENNGKPPVRSVCLRQPGRQKGVRLIHLKSLLDYLNSQLEGGATA
jgi:hypothetical protein